MNANRTIFLDVLMAEDGSVSVDIPRFLLDWKDSKCNEIPFAVVIDGNKIVPEEIYEESFRRVSINVTKGEFKLKIMGPNQFQEINNHAFECNVEFFNISPHLQMEYLDSLDDVVCTEGKTLVIKSHGHMPACVNPSTATVLIERGWGYFWESRKVDIT